MTCPYCHGRGWIRHRGEAMAADPCGYCEEFTDDDMDDVEDENEDEETEE
jgi:hypothetical protein